MSEQQDDSEKKAKSDEKNLFRDVFIDSVEIALKEGNKEEWETRCGFFSWSPEFLQCCATKVWFMIVFSLLAIVQGMSFTYFASTITTLEKRLKISSETARHRPRWMGLGVLMSSLSCFLLASPHFIYGPGDEALSVTLEFYEQFHVHANHSTNSSLADLSESELLMVAREGLCDREGLLDSERGLDCDTSDESWAPLILIFISQFVGGIGIVLFFTLGGPYMDDNMNQTHMPFVMGLTSSFRLIGPVCGFLFGFWCLRIFVSPSLTPTIPTDSPKWIGAWWLGWVVLGVILALFSVFISVFPKKMKKSSSDTKEQTEIVEAKSYVDISKEINNQLSESKEAPKSSWAGMARSLRELLRNKVNLFNTIAGIFYLFPMIGFGMFAPKYLESIYKTSASGASLISGPSIAVQAIGLIISGALISMFQPSARKLAAFNIFTGALSTVVLVLSTQITCHQGTSLGFSGGSMSWKDNFTMECNKDCNCKQNDFDPMCFKEEDRIIYSPCQAGCQSYDKELGIVGNCSCLPNDVVLERGTCSDKSECQNLFYLFIGMRTFVSFIDSFGRIGNMLIGYRCVDPSQKALAIGLVVMTISLFASLPSPLFFGAIVDSVCLLWGSKCGGKGNCLLYDSKKFVYAFNLTASGFLLVAVFFDCMVWYHVKALDLYDESKNVHVKRGKNLSEN